jgi:hypothetical protein
MRLVRRPPTERAAAGTGPSSLDLAWIVTSSAIVGSSAMTRSGLDRSAIAIISRCRCPADSSWGTEEPRQAAEDESEPPTSVPLGGRARVQGTGAYGDSCFLISAILRSRALTSLSLSRRNSSFNRSISSWVPAFRIAA